MIDIILSERDFDYEIQALVNSFFPGQVSRVITGGQRQEEPGAAVTVGIVLGQTEIIAWIQTEGGKREKTAAVSGRQDFHKHDGKTAHPYRTEYKNRLKGLLFDLLKETDTGRLPEDVKFSVPAWGTMTGVRPTKIPMNELLTGKSSHEVRESLLREYRCSGEKAALCTEIAARETKLLQNIDYENGYSLYIGIPFCPTTCLYCSFPSYSMERSGGMVRDYLEALKKEIAYCGKLMEGRKLSSIYMGGGTPTTLSPEQFTELFRCVGEYFPMDQAYEFTVEAGRPDSITGQKLEALLEAGVKRISVNPQTMQDKTLELIGRRHTAAQTGEVFRLARAAGFTNINMDLIIGLPGETVEDFADTLRQIGELSPDSLTVHSLVVKRASRLREILDDRGGLPESERAVRMEQMMAEGEVFAGKHGYLPYYMYRQKNSAGYGGSSGQENIGYSREGKECLYNILIMEEKQTILAVGAGASTKCYDREKNVVSRIENVKSVTDYITRIDEMLERKAAAFMVTV